MLALWRLSTKELSNANVTILGSKIERGIDAEDKWRSKKQKTLVQTATKAASQNPNPAANVSIFPANWLLTGSVKVGRGLRTFVSWAIAGMTAFANGEAIASDTGIANGQARVLQDFDAYPLHASLRGHERGVNAAKFSPDGRTIASASSDLKAKLWDVETAKELLNLSGHILVR
jgi:WD40 repeat protein